ncbi:MAG: rubredoxin [archaeon]|nr:rubredoxin [archaeon]
MTEKKKCSVCGYVYYSEDGCSEKDIPANTLWEDVPEDFKCPLCGAGRMLFK